MEENLEQAGERHYTKVYSELEIPIFFVGSTKFYLPFVNEDLTYHDSPNVDDQMYVTGILGEGDGAFIKNWGYGLYNDTKNETNIKDAYTRIFNTIESVQ